MEADRKINGNLAIQPAWDGHGCDRAIIPRPLAEEAIQITLGDLRQLFEREELLKAAQEATPVHFQILGNAFSVHLVAEPHRLPGRRGAPSDTEVVRLWLVCMGCRHKARKLFTINKFPGSTVLVMPSCRRCMGLTYQSQNCGGNRWWREAARPLKRLLRRRERLQARKQSARIAAQVDLLDQSINLLRQRAAPKSRTKSRTTTIGPDIRIKRPYRDLSLIGLQ